MNAEAFDEYVSRAENAGFRLRVSAVSSRSLRVVEEYVCEYRVYLECEQEVTAISRVTRALHNRLGRR